MGIRRTVQIACLVFFLVLLTMAVSPALPTVLPYLPIDLFLRLDPSIAAVTAVGGRVLLVAFIPAAVVVVLGPILGRAFCGWVCPLGTTIDGGDKLLAGETRNYRARARWWSVKYLVLAFLLGAAVLGVSLVFWVSPLSLATRFYGLLIHPLLAFLADLGLTAVRPLGEWFDLGALTFAEVRTPHFATQLFILAFFAALFATALIAPRFWCRTLCPAGAIIALTAHRPLVRRRVSRDCTKCGDCFSVCPMGAIPAEGGTRTMHRECILCRTCQTMCPSGAVTYLPGPKAIAPTVGPEPVFSPTRRQFLTTGLAGLGVAAVNRTGLSSPWTTSSKGLVAAPGLIRPPGAVPEIDFLARCVSCGECMAACPYNALQPIWLKAGFMAMFSPALTPRRGYCDPGCRRCGDVCPTDAIRELILEERVWAKVGTAAIRRELCLAWEHEKKCMICDEVCPYGAVVFSDEKDIPVPVPRVEEEKCSGCGYCEHFCPVVNQAAIVVTPMGALRMEDGSYRQEGRHQGLNITIRTPGQYPRPQTAPPDEPALDGLPPGFTD